MSKGLLFVMSGPSGVGKGTLRELMMEDESLNLAYSISMTTRKPRNGEIDGEHYFFTSVERFQEAIKNGEMLEHAIFCDNYYGTPKAYVDELREQGKNVLLEIEVEGATQVMNQVDDAITIFITPPSMEELEKRIRGRKTEPDEVIHQRLEKARKEIKRMQDYRYIVCNDDLALASNITKTIMKYYIDKNEQQ